VLKKNIASATTHYGILGQKATALSLDTGIEGDGRKTEPVRVV
jgi:hypothetical protein